MPRLNLETPDWMTEDLDIFRDAAIEFFERELLPHNEMWIKRGFVDRRAREKAGEAGMLCASIPEQYGGAGGTFAHEAMIIGESLQFFGGYGYMDEYPISRMYTDARVQKICGGANEIMKLLIAQTL